MLIDGHIVAKNLWFGKKNSDDMKAKRRTEITTETHERTIIHFRDSQRIVFCVACAAQTAHLSSDQAEQVFSMSESGIERLVNEKRIHTLDIEKGLPLICGDSLLEYTNNKEKEKDNEY